MDGECSDRSIVISHTTRTRIRLLLVEWPRIIVIHRVYSHELERTRQDNGASFVAIEIYCTRYCLTVIVRIIYVCTYPLVSDVKFSAKLLRK